MTVTLTTAQAAVVDKIHDWLRNGNDQSFTLAGYAGTGKTTIIRQIIEGTDRRVHCCTPTGKAAYVLESKLKGVGVEVTTLHSFLYAPVDVTKADVEAAELMVEQLRARGLPHEDAERRARKLGELLEKSACEFRNQDTPNYMPIVVVDEASMVGDKIEADLRAQAGKILFVGDPGQLPPVEGTEFFSRNRPDAVLEEIHRQAAESAILRLATAIRRSEKFTDWNADDCVLINDGRAGAAELEDADVVITGKNDTRRRLNRDFRSMYGHGGKFPEVGEPIMCLRNNQGRGLINGVGGLAASVTEEDTFGDLHLDVSYDGRLIQGLAIDPFPFLQYERPDLSRRDMPPKGDAQFDFGYAITCHKSQGSEWPHVAVWDDKMRRFDKEARKRWIYTAATRAARKLTWVNGDGRKK